MYAPGITLVPWTIGGTSTTEAGEALFTRAKVTASRSLMLWGPTGWRYESATKTYTSTEGAELSGASPACDQAGWRTEDNAIIDVSIPGSYTHTYTFKVSQFRMDGAGREIPVGTERTYANVFLPTGDGSPIDLETLLPVGTQAGGVVLVPDSWDARVAAAEAAAAEAASVAGSAADAAVSAANAEAARDQTLAVADNVPQTVDDDGTYSLIWSTLVGRRVLGGITPTGQIAPVGGVLLGSDTIKAGTDPAYNRLTLHPGAGTAHDRMAEDAVGADGNFTLAGLTHMAGRMPGVRPKGRGIICRGDSLTAGAYGSGTTYPGHLSTLCPGVPVAKRGNPGERAREIAMRQGAEPLVTTAAVTIPASGGGAVSMNTTIMFTNASALNGIPDGIVMTGSLNGIRGVLTITGGVFTFTRSATGEAFDVPTGTPWLDDWESTRRDWNQILWIGRNNVTTTPADVVTYVAKMTAYQTGGDYVVLSITNGTAEPSGSANYITLTGINAALAAAHGPRYFDLRAWLITSGLAAVSLAPTADDTTAIAQDRIPPSLLAADGLHFNANGYKATAIGVRAFINGRGWL